VAGRKGYILVEGHGEVQAAQNLVVRLSAAVGLSVPWKPPLRWTNLHQWQPKRGKGGIRRGAEFVRGKADAGALLILRDEDDACPKQTAPQVADQLRELRLPFPVAYVLLHPEYEVLFLPCLAAMELPPWDGTSWESRRGIKEWLSAQLPRGRSYKPSVDQLRLTQRIELSTLRAAGVPCFGTLERAIGFFADPSRAGAVYP